MCSDRDPKRKHRRVYPIDALPSATQRERDQFRQRLKRESRRRDGRCPYCGHLPEPGHVRCGRCLELQRRQGARLRERERARRDAARRAARPRECPKCGGGDLKQREIRHGRPYYTCRACGRSSFGDGPAPPLPDYPCPYCGGRCVKRGRCLDSARKPQLYLCRACGRVNSELWPESVRSPGGPFPHRVQFGLSEPARQAILIYCQEKKLSIAQAIRDILIRAAQAPLAHITVGRGRIPGDSAAGSAATRVHSVAIPGPPPPAIPPGGLHLPSACPASLEKLCRVRVRNHFVPSVLVTLTVSMRLNDAALVALLEIMRRRNLNHQDAARAVIAETRCPNPPIILTVPRNNLDDDW